MSKLITNGLRHLGASVDNLTLDNAGRVLMPNQPFFLARVGTAYAATPDTTLQANTTRHNVGGHYNASNYRFTAPVSGVYVFGGNLRTNANHGYVYQDPRVNGTRIYDSFGFLPGLNTTGSASGFTAGSVSYAIFLNAGDYVEQNIGFDGSPRTVDAQSYWFGYLLG